MGFFFPLLLFINFRFVGCVSFCTNLLHVNKVFKLEGEYSLYYETQSYVNLNGSRPLDIVVSVLVLTD